MKTINRHLGKRALVVFALSLILALVNSCSKSSSNEPVVTPPASNTVTIQSMAFSPSTITITAGATVKWTNNDAIAHTVTSNTGAFDSGNMAAGATYSYTFSTAGTYNYHCTYHSGMTGTVMVNAASTSGGY
jgi:plastocyanin